MGIGRVADARCSTNRVRAFSTEAAFYMTVADTCNDPELQLKLRDYANSLSRTAVASTSIAFTPEVASTLLQGTIQNLTAKLCWKVNLSAADFASAVCQLQSNAAAPLEESTLEEIRSLTHMHNQLRVDSDGMFVLTSDLHIVPLKRRQPPSPRLSSPPPSL